LAASYDQAGQPVFFLEQHVDRPVGNRIERWWDARSGVSCVVPLVIVDSGFRVTCGPEDFETVYRGLVDQALANPPAGDVTATYRRVGNGLSVAVKVTNRSGVALGNANFATVNVLVFERVKVVHTNRFVRAAGQTDITTDQPDGRTAYYDVWLNDVPVADWSKATVIVLVDYMANPASGRFVSLQAAVADLWGSGSDVVRLALPLTLRTRPGR